MTLTSPRFSFDQRLQAAARNAPPLRAGDTGVSVRRLQQGFIDCGFPMPRSTRRYGTPDGIYGGETRQTCIAFQRREHLSQDGSAGRNTLHRLDALLPNNAPSLPPLPAPPLYVVPGLKTVIAQPTNLVCWATVYCMMLSWRDQLSYSIEESADAVAIKYGNMVRNNQSLPTAEFGPFIQAAGMRLEPMANLPLSTWGDHLRSYGLLWVGQLNFVGPGAGLHSRIVEGLVGAEGRETMMIIDPAGGRRYQEQWDRFLYKYEQAIAGIGGQYYQIRHF